jgi:hypothetical protein
VTVGDGCDDSFGSGVGIKNTVTIVTTVTFPKPLPRPRRSIRRLGAGLWTAAVQYGSTETLVSMPLLMMWYIVSNGQGSRRSRIPRFPLGEPTILCSRRMKVS